MQNVDNSEQLTVLSLCTGYGGLELGLARALENPLRVVAVEVEAYALANLVAKAEEGKLAIEALWPDLRTFPAGRFRGCFDFILAGYPCQPFSCAGKRKGHDDPRHLWPTIAGIIKAVEPVWCFFENVPGHLSLGFPDVYRSLRNLGYKVEAGLFSAATCGATHRRERLFILANSQHDDVVIHTREKCVGVEKRQKEFCELEWGQGRMLESERMGGSFWPSGPFQKQVEWEERRTVESRLGRANARFESWVDRLRLLGNGVVPQQAAKAFRHLMETFTNG